MPGRFAGSAYVQGRASLAGIEVQVFDSLGVNVLGDTVLTDGDGHFLTPELAPGTYRVALVVPLGNAPAEKVDVSLAPAELKDIGLLTSLIEPPVGRIRGAVTLQGSPLSPLGVRLVLTRQVGAAREESTREVIIGAASSNGEYEFSELIAGEYEIRSDREGFTPDVVTISVPSNEPAAQVASEMRLYPASAVVRFSVPTSAGQTVGAPFTSSRTVSLVMLAFGGVNEMRFSESEGFLENGVEVAFRDYVAEVPLTLSEGEGTKMLYAQFRVVGPSGERLRTETYRAQIIYDATPPSVLSAVLAPSARVIDGVRYLSDGSSSTLCTVIALDAQSRIAGVKLVPEGASAASVPYTVLAATDANTTFSATTPLSPGQGVKTVGVQLIDGAGNESALLETSVTVDSEPPTLGAPAIVARDAIGTSLGSQTQTLRFDAAGATRMRYGIAPAPASGAMLPYFPEATVSVPFAHGASVQFYAVFEDEAGNSVSVTSGIYTMNLKGGVSGSVLLEGETDHSGIDIAVLSGASVVGSGTNLPSGAYDLQGLEPGDYTVRFSRAGSETLTRGPVQVRAAETITLGTDRLTLSRGTLIGTALYADKAPGADHGGIAVIALRAGRTEGPFYSDSTGRVVLANIPAGPGYELRVSAAGYLTSSTAGITVLASPATNAPLSVVSLAKLAGDFKICDRDDSAPQSKDCTAIAYANESQVLLGFDANAVTHVRYVVQNPSSPGAASFSNPSADPNLGQDLCASPPQANCWNPYSGSMRYLLNLGATQDRIAIVAQFADGSGLRVAGTSEVVYDATPPSGVTVDIGNGAGALLLGYTSSPSLSVAVSASLGAGTNEKAPLRETQLSRDATWSGSGVANDVAYAYGGPHTFSVSASDGTKSVYAWVCDAAGNCSTPAVQDTIVLDSTRPLRSNGRDVAPSGAGVSTKNLAAREWWTRSLQPSALVSVGTSSYGLQDVAAFRFSLSEQFLGATYTNIDLSQTAAGGSVTAQGPSLPPVDGSYVVYSSFLDIAGNESNEAASDRYTLVLDTTPPTGTVTLAGGAAYTNATNVGVTLTSDAATQMQTSWTGALPLPTDTKSAYATSFTSAPPVGDGEKTLLVRLFDAAGNYVERQDTVIVDRTAPLSSASASCTSCTQSGGSLYYRDTLGQVSLALFASDSSGIISNVRIVIDQGTGAQSTQNIAYAPTATITVSTSVGAHTLDITFTDAAGNDRAVPRINLIHDRTAPTASVSIDAGATYTRDPIVTLAITANDANGLTGMYVSSSSTFAGASLVSFNSTFSWTLDNPDSNGTKTVYVRVVDASGLTTDASDTIELDVQAPQSTSASWGFGTYATTTSATLTLSASGATQMYIDGDVNDTAVTKEWISYGTSAAIVLTSTQGTKNVTVRFRDAAGNESATTNLSTILDTTAPTLSAVTIIGANKDGTPNTVATATLDVQVDLSSVDATKVAVSTSGSINCATASYSTTYSARIPVTIAAGGTVHVCVSDAAGNTAGPANDSISIDTTAPSCTLSLAGFRADGATVYAQSATHTALPTLRVTASCSGAPAGMALVPSSSSIDCATASYTSYSASAQVSVSTGDGAKNVLGCFRDAVGNFTAAAVTASTDLVLDQTPPSSVSLAIAKDGESDPADITASINVDLFLDADGASEMIYSRSADLSAGGGAGTGTWTTFATTKRDLALQTYAETSNTCVASPSGLSRRVYARFRDALYNQSAVVVGRIVLDTCAPSAPTVTLVSASPPSLRASTEYTNSRLVTMTIAGTSGAAALRVGGTTGSCPAASTLERVNVTTSTVLTFASDALSRGCVALEDAAGNFSSVASDTITVDTTPPTAPTLSPSNLTNVNYSCALITPPAITSAIDTNFYKWQQRSNGSAWGDTTLSAGQVNFSLLQDTTNSLEVRAIDMAGNIGESNQALVEEASSSFVSTGLTVKMLCSNGTFAILKDYSNTLPVAAGVSNEVVLVNAVEHALFDLTTQNIARFDGDSGSAQWIADKQGDQDLKKVIDIACAYTDDALLVTYVEDDLRNSDPTYVQERMYVWDAPLSRPTSPDFYRVDGAACSTAGGCTGNLCCETGCSVSSCFPIRKPSTDDQPSARLGVSSVDVLEWNTTPPNFRALAVDATFIGSNARRLTYSGTTLSASIAHSGALGGFASVKGLAMSASYDIYGIEASADYELYRSLATVPSGGDSATRTQISDVAGGDDKWGVWFRPSVFLHGSATTRQSVMTYVDAAGDVRYVLASSGGTASIASGAGQRTGYTDMVAGSVWWIDRSDEKSFRVDDVYTNAGTQAYRYKVDTTRPLWPTGKTGAGEATVIYHTGGVGSPKGIVVGYRDQVGCAQ